MDTTQSISKLDYLWRYMDFDKFVNLVAYKSLFFQSVRSFEDNYENYCDIVKAVVTGEDIDSIYDFYTNREPKFAKPLTDTDQKTKWLAELFCIVQDATTVSCWHHNNEQSEAMWKLYSTNVNSAVAIRTTVGKIQELYSENRGYETGKVEYIDYKEFVPDLYDAKWYKRKIFEHENEFRIVRVEPNYGQKAKNSDGSLARSEGVAHNNLFEFNDVIDAIIISPYAPEHFADTVAAIKSKYGLKCPIVFQDRVYPAEEHWEKPRSAMERIICEIDKQKAQDEYFYDIVK